MTIHVEITQEDIERCQPGSQVTPLTLAVRRELLNQHISTEHFYVGAACAYVQSWPYELPQCAVDWIRAWDRGELVAPLAFELRLERVNGRGKKEVPATQNRS